MKKRLCKEFAAFLACSVLVSSIAPMSVFAQGTDKGYGYEVEADNTTFRAGTDNSEAFKEWRTNVWDAGESADSGKIALTPGTDETGVSFTWYSKEKGTPAIKIWEAGKEAEAKIVTGEATDINQMNWQGSVYVASNKVYVEKYLKENTNYFYAYTSDYQGDATVWEKENAYNTGSFSSFTAILTGDPQVGASGSSNDKTKYDDSAARDTYNWNWTVQNAVQKAGNAAFLLSAGDQIDKSNATKEEDRKTRESEYAGYLYPDVFRSLPIASTIGNHDRLGDDYTFHFANPNASDLGATEAGGDYYFSYGDALFISLNSNNRNQEEHRELLKQAVASDEDAVWKVVIFHSDIYGSGEPHADTDAASNRIIFAPLMDEFDIDICLTGHDHTYSRSYQIYDGNVIDYDLSNGSVTNPEGTLYITTGSGSGSKYYN